MGNYPGNGARFSRLVVVRDASVPVKGLLCDNIKWDALTPGLTQGTVDGEFVRLLHDVSSARGRVLPGPQARRGRRTDHYYSIASPLQSSGEAGRTAEYVEGRGLPLAEFRVMMASASRAALTGSADVRVQADAAYARDWAAFADAVVAVRTAELAGAGGPPAGAGAPGGGGPPAVAAVGGGAVNGGPAAVGAVAGVAAAAPAGGGPPAVAADGGGAVNGGPAVVGAGAGVAAAAPAAGAVGMVPDGAAAAGAAPGGNGGGDAGEAAGADDVGGDGKDDVIGPVAEAATRIGMFAWFNNKRRRT